MQHAELKAGDNVHVRATVLETMSDRLRIRVGDKALSHIVYVPRDHITRGPECAAIETPHPVIETLCGPIGRAV